MTPVASPALSQPSNTTKSCLQNGGESSLTLGMTTGLSTRTTAIPPVPPVGLRPSPDLDYLCGFDAAAHPKLHQERPRAISHHTGPYSGNLPSRRGGIELALQPRRTRCPVGRPVRRQPPAYALSH